MKRFFWNALLTGTFLAGTLLAGAAHATTVPPLSLTDQARRAQVIVRATLGQPTNEKDGDVPYLAYPLTITETISGDSKSLPQLSGKPVLYVLQGAADLPTLSQGQGAIFLLYTAKMDSPIVGYNQGIYPVVGGKIVPVNLNGATSPNLSSTGTTSAATAPAQASAAGDITDPVKLRDALRAARGNK